MSDTTNFNELKSLLDWVNQSGDIEELSIKYGDIELALSKTPGGLNHLKEAPAPAAPAPAPAAAAAPAPASPVPTTMTVSLRRLAGLTRRYSSRRRAQACSGGQSGRRASRFSPTSYRPPTAPGTLALIRSPPCR